MQKVSALRPRIQISDQLQFGRFKVRAEYFPGFFVRQHPRGVRLSDIIAVIACDRARACFNAYFFQRAS